VSNDAPSVSVVICSAGRADLLLDGLAELARHPDWRPTDEVLVVLNGPDRDPVRRLIEQARSGGPRLDDGPTLRVAEVEALGISRARNCGTRLATGDLIISLDDDARPLPGWLEAWRAAFAADPDLAAAGGPIELGWPTSGPPRWFQPQLATYWSQLLPRVAPLDAPPEMRAFGANLAMRRLDVERIGGFDEQLGRGGTLGITGEESDLLRRLHHAGRPIGWVPDARVVHLVPPGRARLSWLVRRAHEQGRTDRVLRASTATWWQPLISGWPTLARQMRQTPSSWRGHLASDLARRARLAGRTRGRSPR
jgi:GT2 family glycosyltransferase